MSFGINYRSVMTRRKLIFVFLLALVYVTAYADDNVKKSAHRPKIGLVLSGGGAHGITHVGVLKVMEEAGLRPDYITGVSMGSIIGGLYSCGYSADSIQKILKSINWKFILSNKIPENKVIFLEKGHFANSIISLPLSSRKVILPSGLINGQQVENTLNYYTWPAADISDFSRLPIPFLCVATDIINYKKVDIKTGYLADAIRASFSVPSIFTPHRIDTMLLLDGGLIRNFAATEAKEMGADILIGSYVGFNGYKADKLQTVSGIMEQIALFRSLDDFDSEKKLVKVLIKPKTTGYSIFVFDNVDSLIRRGYEAALPYREYFRKLADSLNAIGVQQPVADILHKKTYTFDRIKVSGNKTYPEEQILGVLDVTPGKPVDKDMLNEKIDLLYGKAWFEKVSYKIKPVNDSLILNIDCIEKPNAMMYGSVHYDNSLLSVINLELSLKNLITPRSAISIGARIGQNYLVDLSYLQFIDKNQIYGLSANFFSENTVLPLLITDGDQGEVISRDFSPGLSVNRRIGLNNMMSINASFDKRLLILNYISDVHLKSLSYNYFTIGYDYSINSLDSKYFPDKGTILNFTVNTSKLQKATIKSELTRTPERYYDGSTTTFDRFYTLRAGFDHFYSPGQKVTLRFGADVLHITKSDSLSSRNNFYLLGGMEPINRRSVTMPGFHPNEIPVSSLAAVRTAVDYEMFDSFHLTFTAGAGALKESNRSGSYSMIYGASLGAGYMSIIGPIKIGIMYGQYNNEEYFKKVKGFLSIGFNF